MCLSQLLKLEEENDNLVGKHSKHSQQMQEETINLPDNMEVWTRWWYMYIDKIQTAISLIDKISPLGEKPPPTSTTKGPQTHHL